MNHTEAKFILSAYRPDGSDAADATFCAALAHAKTDPTLLRWFELEQQFDRAMGAKLADLAPPAGLREAILAGARASAGPAESRDWWRQPAWLAAAAGIAVFFAAGLAFWPKQAAASADFTTFIIEDASNSQIHGGQGGHNDAFQAAFMQPTVKLGDPMAIDFEKLRTTGCRTIRFAGRDVLEVCFKRDGVWFHCYVVRKADFPTLVAAAEPTITDHGKSFMAAWADREHVIFVISKVSRDALQQLI